MALHGKSRGNDIDNCETRQFYVKVDCETLKWTENILDGSRKLARLPCDCESTSLVKCIPKSLNNEPQLNFQDFYLSELTKQDLKETVQSIASIRKHYQPN